MNRPRLLVLSHVTPVPRRSGQQQRVHFTLRAARDRFHVTFVGISPRDDVRAVEQELGELCDDVVFLPDSYAGNRWRLAYHRGRAVAHTLRTGLKRSNYAIGRVHFAPDRIRELLSARQVDCALFEYWHAVDSVPVFHERGIPCVLDMHDILSHSRDRELSDLGVPSVVRSWEVARYQTREQRAWNAFDALVAINREEERYVRGVLAPGIPVFHAAMGTDLTAWPYSWIPATPPRVAYYAGLGSAHNQRAARFCVSQVMPAIWESRPDVELWLVGSDPPEALRQLTADARIKVTGYLKEPQSVLKTMSAVLCPWWGKYGFRSRIVEVMALGVPTVATPDAVWGMELENRKGLLIGETADALARHTVAVINNRTFAEGQSRSARRQVERAFGLANTYGQLVTELEQWLERRPAVV